MTLQADALVDRRRLKRRLSLWRVLAIVLALALIAAFVLRIEGIASAVGLGSQVARVTVGGIIRDDRNQQELLSKIAKANHVKALILRINSPGGTTSGGESLFEAIRGVAEKKPVVAVFGTVATSAAYMAALGSDHIVARANTITGSVGVIFQWAEVTKLMKTLGVKIEEIKSGPLKANPSPFQPIDEAGRRLSEEMVGEAQKWFVDLVAKRRAIKPDQVPGLTDGRVFSGRQARRLKLIDQIGGEDGGAGLACEGAQDRPRSAGRRLEKERRRRARDPRRDCQNAGAQPRIPRVCDRHRRKKPCHNSQRTA